VKGENLYAIVMGKSAGAEVAIHSLPRGGENGTVHSVTLLGSGSLHFKQDGAGLTVTVPDAGQRHESFVLKIEGLKTNPHMNTDSGNPTCDCGLAP